MNAPYAPGVPDVTVPPQLSRADADLTWRPPHALDMRATLGRLGRGPGDPTHQFAADGGIWRTARTADGPATAYLRQVDRSTVTCHAWGPGAGAMISGVPDLLGARDDHTDFAPQLPAVAEAHRLHPGLRTPRTGYVLDSLMAAVFEQRVITVDAQAAWRRLIRRHGDLAPGPAPAGMRLPLSPAQWVAIPSWEWHKAGVDARRARTAIACAHAAKRVEEAASMSCAAAQARLMAIPGVGAWTAAEVAQRALGDADAVSVGDYHLAASIGWTFVGRPVDDAEMLTILEEFRPFRYRVVRLLQLTGRLTKPRFGPRATRDTSNLR